MKKLLISILVGLSIVTCGFANLGKERIAIAMAMHEVTEDDEITQQAIIESIPETYDAADTASEPNNKVFTLEELKNYDGKNGKPAYIAVDGVVYDVTNSKKWKSGKHCNVNAGNDLSKEIGTSPHGKEALKKLTVVGVLK